MLPASPGSMIHYYLFKAIPPANDKRCVRLQCTCLSVLSNWFFKVFVVPRRQ